MNQNYNTLCTGIKQRITHTHMYIIKYILHIHILILIYLFNFNEIKTQYKFLREYHLLVKIIGSKLFPIHLLCIGYIHR